MSDDTLIKFTLILYYILWKITKVTPWQCNPQSFTYHHHPQRPSLWNNVFMHDFLLFIDFPGSRVDKHWFIVRDTSVKTERLLTLVGANASCPIKCDQSTRTTLLDLFLNLQHPYIYPVLDLEFRESPTGEETYIILVIPFNGKGSLKDLISKVSIPPLRQ